jgi:hypothetical protein
MKNKKQQDGSSEGEGSSTPRERDASGVSISTDLAIIRGELSQVVLAQLKLEDRIVGIEGRLSDIHGSIVELSESLKKGPGKEEEGGIAGSDKDIKEILEQIQLVKGLLKRGGSAGSVFG